MPEALRALSRRFRSYPRQVKVYLDQPLTRRSYSDSQDAAQLDSLGRADQLRHEKDVSDIDRGREGTAARAMAQ